MLLFIFLACISAAYAAFTHAASWRFDSIVQTEAGTWCYQPRTSFPTQTARRCTNATLSTLIEIHVNNTCGIGLSIAYYDLADFSTLGGAGWSGWKDLTLPVGVCMSGAVMAGRTVDSDPRYVTLCRFAKDDDDHDSSSSHESQCIVALPQKFVSDGCYDPSEAIGQQVILPSPTSAFDRAITIISAVAATIAIWGAGWALLGYIQKRRAAQANAASGDDMPLIERVPARED